MYQVMPHAYQQKVAVSVVGDGRLGCVDYPLIKRGDGKSHINGQFDYKLVDAFS